MQTLVLLTVLAAVTFLAYSNYLDASRLANENQMLRKLISLERKIHEQENLFGTRHPLVIEMASEIAETESEIERATPN
ncbi:MAG: hypothetical protein AAGJ83_10495 [Planctomycetota bacterium]